MSVNEQIMIDIEVEGLHTCLGTEPSTKEGFKRNLDFVCQAAYYQYNVIEEESFRGFGQCYQLRQRSVFFSNKEKSFLMKLKNKSTGGNVIIEEANPCLIFGETAWQTM